MASVDEFVQGYVDAVGFCGSVLNADNGSGEGDLRSPSDLGLPFGRSTERRLRADARRFFKAHRNYIEAASVAVTYDRLGNDFWLTREGHGTGYWDEPCDTEGACQALAYLTEAAKAEGSGQCFRAFRGAVHFL